VVLSQAEDEGGIERFQVGIGEYIGPGNAAVLVAGHRSGRLPEALRSWGEGARQEGALWPQWRAPLAIFYVGSLIWLVAYRVLMTMAEHGKTPEPAAGLHLLPGLYQSILIVALVVVTGLILCFRLGPNHPRFYRKIEGLWWYFPRLGPALRQLDKVRLLRMLAWGAETGQPLTQTLRIAAGGLQSPRLKASMESAASRAQTGASFSEVVSTFRVFSRMEHGVFVVGEETGDLPRMLGAQAESATEELERLIQKTQKGVVLFGWFFYLLPFVTFSVVYLLVPL
jgi:type II secretory pathway component PulF